MRPHSLPVLFHGFLPIGGRPGIAVLLVWLLVPVLATIISGAAMAQGVSSSAVQISFTANQSELTVGDPVTLTLDITHPSDHVVVVPRLGRFWGQFEVLSQTAAQITVGDTGTSTTRQWIDVTLFSTGSFETPALPLTVRKPDGSVEQLSSPVVRLNVKSVLSGPDEPLRDIREPVDLETPLWEKPLARVIGLSSIVVLCAAGYILRRSLRRRETQLTEEDERTPWDKAIQGLDEIEGQDLPAAGDYRQHYTLVSQVVRSYMGIICFPDDGREEAPRLTTEELEAGLRNSTLEPSIERLVIDLLEDADSVKFANHIPTSAEAQEALRRARFIVETTEPIHENATAQNKTGQRKVT